MRASFVNIPTLLGIVLLLLVDRLSYGQSLDLNPTRPTVANSTGIQGKGVLQVEVGEDSYPQVFPSDQETTALAVFYVPFERLRIDFGWSAFNTEATRSDSHRGVGTIQVGGKVLLRKEVYRRSFPGVGLQYEATLPTASDSQLQDKGQQLILLLNHHYGRHGMLDVIANGSLVQSGCADQSRCRYGGQQSAALSLHVRESTRLYAEVFGQNNAQSNTPPGTYAFGGFYHKINDSFGIDGGMRFGLSSHSASFGPTLGVVFGKRLQASGAQSDEPGVVQSSDRRR